MNGLEAAGVVLAGVFAGAINTVVGSGTLVTFPMLLAVGYPPVTANVSNSIGLVPGSLSGAVGYRHELTGQAARLLRLGSASLLGGIIGALLLLVLPAAAFEVIVPVLIALAIVLVLAQPRLARWVTRRRSRAVQPARRLRGVEGRDGPGLWIGVFLTGVYGGYFGAAQGVLLLGLVGVLMDEHLQRVNAVKNVLVLVVNLVAGIVFVLVAHVAWLAVLLVAAGSAVGGIIGARIARRMPPTLLRAVIVIVGLIAIVELLR